MKKTNNKGFSLVELIVVVAIMAILIGVLAPQYLRYVEKSRLQKDNTALGEIAQSIKIALSDEKIAENMLYTSGEYDMVFTHTTGNAQTYTFTTATAEPTPTTADSSLLGWELSKTIAKDFTTSSNTYKDATDNIVIEVVYKDGVITVQAEGYIDSVSSKTGTVDSSEHLF